MDKDYRLMEVSCWEETGENWVLFWWVGPCSVNLESNFLLMGGTVFPSWCLTWYQTMVEVIKLMATSFKRSHAHIATPNISTLQQATTDPHLQRLLTLTGKSGLVSCRFTAPFSWVLVYTGFVCALQESVSLFLCKFCNQIPLACKVKFPGGSQTACQIPLLGNLLWVLEFS